MTTIFTESSFENVSEAFSELATTMCEFVENIKDYLIELSENLFPMNNFVVYMQNTYPNKRVKHLAVYSKSVRIRKKNLKRIIKSYQKYSKKEVEL